MKTAALTEQLGQRSVALDGEFVVIVDGRPSLRLLQRRNGQPTALLMRNIPVSYYVFDLLSLDGESTCTLPYARRRRRGAARRSRP